ncbi:WXG100 family type VII secretion target [Streptomyces sp. AB3(2024)]|uniref:WXG100 family type VII secretion target n=1 Tax=Streptomyces sp. AB3(2024) TaxID=3317321 RepID=UPI0035A37876
MATDFEAYSHEQLLAMIASLDSATVVARATQLQGAAVAIKDIGESLRKHQVTGWEGEAADSFQEWVTWAGNATLRLADYSEEGSKWMTQAAQTMLEVKTNTPKYDTSAAADLAAAHKFHNDPDAQQLGRTAHSKLNGDRQEAIQQLTKLAQSYDLSATQMNKAEIPTFPPPPKVFEPIRVSAGDTDLDRARGGSIGGSVSGSASYVPPTPGSGASSNVQSSGTHQLPPDSNLPTQPHPTPSPSQIISGRDVGVDLDHVATLPDRTAPPATGGPGGPSPVGPSIPSGGPLLPPPLPPVPGHVGRTGGPFSGTRPPVGVGGKGGGIPVLSPRDTGIVGGKPLSPNSPTPGISRGTVIGAEGTQTGARGGMMGGGGLGGPHGPSGSGSVAGRRLAMEPGGVVGGRQNAGGSRSVAGGQSFTQGGSGLVRGGSGAGALGHGGGGVSGPGKPRGGPGTGRPDYLAEDEETWQGDRRVVPPVID